MEPARAVLIAFAGMVGGAWPLAAQVQRSPRPEIRLDALGASAPSAQVAGGLSFPVSTYLRLAAIAGGGVARRAGESRAVERADLVMRFVVDPAGESGHSLYGLGGISVRHDGFDGWRPDILVGLGIEGRFRAPITPAFELSLGGGLRASVVLRWVRGDVR